MNKKKISVVCFHIIVGMAFLIFISAVSVEAAEVQYKFRIGQNAAKESPLGQGTWRVAEVAEQLSKGRIKIDVFDAAKLGGELDMVSQIRMGSLEMALIGSGMVGSVEPTFSITELPFIWKSGESSRKVLDGPIGNKLLAMLEPKGIKGLAWGEWGFRGILTTKKPLETLEDFKGLKIRVIENPLYITTFRAFGANPVPMDWPEVYTALQQGTIDGVDTNPASMVDYKLYENCKCVAAADHIYTAVVVIMNLKTFRSLPKDLQQVIVKASKEGGDRTRELATKKNNDAIEFMGSKGLKITRPDRKIFESKLPEIYKRFSAQIGQDFINEVIAAQK